MNLPKKQILSQHVAILGKTRSGKSSVARGLVEGLLQQQQPVCIVDPKGDWWGLKLAADGKHAGYPVVIFGGEHADVPINENAGAHVAELFATGNRPCLIDLGGWTVGARTRFWIEFASTLFKLTRGQRWLVVDEVHNFCPKGKVFDAEAGKALHWTNRLASEGLGKGLAMIFASQRPQKVHNDTLTSAETLIAMRVLHPSDRGAISEWIKGCGNASGDEVLANLANMDRGEGWVWCPEAGFGPTRVKFPMFETYDSFRPQTAEDTRKLKGWAEVDLDDVRQKMATVIEAAKADDPKALRVRIAELERELRTAQSKAPASVRVSVPAELPAELRFLLSNAGPALKGIADRVKMLDADAHRRHARATSLIQTISQALTEITDVHPTIVELAKQVGDLQKMRGDADMATALAKRQPVTETLKSAASPAPRAAMSAGPSDPSLSGRSGLRRMLIALAQRPQGLTRPQLGMRAQVAPAGGSFDTYTSRGRTNGWIEGDNSLFKITPAGLIALGSYDPLPMGRELGEYYVRHFGTSGAARMLQALINAWPGAMARDALSVASNVSAAGGSFDTYLSRLRVLELVTGKSEIKASDEIVG